MRLPIIISLLLAVCAHAELRENIEFAVNGGVHLTLDANVPDGPGPFPTVIVVHGGGWVNGDKQTYVKPILPPLTKAGFTWFTINYRLAPQWHFPAQLDDLESAIVWVKKHVREYKADPNRMAILGESAGGHIVALAGAKFTPATRVKAVVVLYGPHDLLARARKMGTVGENVRKLLDIPDKLDAASEKKLRAASPITYVKKNMPPYLLIHGTKDEKVPYELSVSMCAKMKEAGASCELFTVQDGIHGMGGWEKNPAQQAYKEKTVEWLKNKLSN
jgi:acetyl esterase